MDFCPGELCLGGFCPIFPHDHPPPQWRGAAAKPRSVKKLHIERLVQRKGRSVKKTKYFIFNNDLSCAHCGY